MLAPHVALSRIQAGALMARVGRVVSFVFLGPVFTVSVVLALLGIASWRIVLVLLVCGAVLTIVQVLGSAIVIRTRKRIRLERGVSAEAFIDDYLDEIDGETIAQEERALAQRDPLTSLMSDHTCDACGEGFTSPGTLYEHRREVHGQSP